MQSPSSSRQGLLGLTGAWITAHLIDGSVHLGFVHAVDPETGNVVLLRPEPAGPPGAVLPMVLLHDAIAEALRRQRIPFQLEGCGGEDLLVLGCLRCVPPYNARAVSCENEIVLSRFTELLAGV
ncbi:hypothetical protein EMIHUDRAFT_194708 [Emiliania huxleyi CCMP1516]|uniref:AD domain-containing protein n=2 Tax=Emiliania huxleyi TaxID=2903 RepID=A0A0D3IW65_EMIH1|nr:hypothetical protein EMIHUDRAFT_245807 [Emiliania huxleyi CCMP1516]XP_005794458.1 hypothetical protein EMIHUDRAFT_194708 [Emiliania huxleyi CCMP1516]EOD15500.1 hypothetical protein EMIHUDRAFT_245807 [Emiliania huxleyi CCMP1516]EOD42029.1 hypothetical protein EMIHUDRAFT_194708 [Emiliania huxleyi CCMP1516]|eukprot:XP_005767929.1 hypothetical protein EMIHUDRAFT_245807 [Emiliania huxleyi CCMP1516]